MRALFGSQLKINAADQNSNDQRVQPNRTMKYKFKVNQFVFLIKPAIPVRNIIST